MPSVRIIRVALAGAVLAVAGCSSGSSSPADAVKNAVKATVSAGSVKESVQAVTPTASGQSTTSASGAFNFPKKQGLFSVDTGIIGKLDAEIDGTNLYVHLPPAVAAQVPGKKPWVKIDLTHPPTVPGIGNLGQLAAGADPSTSLRTYEMGITSAKKLGAAKVGNDDTTHYSATIDFAKAKAAAPKDQQASIQSAIDVLGSPTQQIDVYIGSGNRLRRIVAQTQSGAAKGSTVTTDLSDYGTDVKVTIPAAGETADAATIFGGQ
ncbi:MAG: hypothetical protein NVSMB16_03540 [Acidimicrobiales bacterium]